MINIDASRPLESNRYETTKRAMDVAGAALGLIVTAPVQLVVMALIMSKLGRPVLFEQDRPGLDGKTFRLRKFRTMRQVDESRGMVDDAQRMTAFGNFLRSTSLDELPSLMNVLRGEMSLVGPRPLLVEYLDLYTPEQFARHSVRPGLTGLAQVRGRNSLSWEEKFRLDLEYVQSRSLRLDLKILTETVTAVIGRKDISALESVTMPKFTGSNSGQGN